MVIGYKEEVISITNTMLTLLKGVNIKFDRLPIELPAKCSKTDDGSGWNIIVNLNCFDCNLDESNTSLGDIIRSISSPYQLLSIVVHEIGHIISEILMIQNFNDDKQPKTYEEYIKLVDDERNAWKYGKEFFVNVVEKCGYKFQNFSAQDFLCFLSCEETDSILNYINGYGEQLFEHLKHRKAYPLPDPPEMTDELIEQIVSEGYELERALEARTKDIDKFGIGNWQRNDLDQYIEQRGLDERVSKILIKRRKNNEK